MDRVSIDYGTGTDECQLIGTRKQIKDFLAAVEQALDSGEDSIYYGINVKICGISNSVEVCSNGGIGIDNVIICNDNNDKKIIIKKMTNEQQ